MTVDFVGHELGPYYIAALIDRGGMATVYHASHRVLRWDVALKVLDPSLTGESDFLARFQREAQILAQLKHPNIVAVRDADYRDGYYYIAMELLDGQPLDRLLEQSGQLHPANVTHFAIQVAQALAYAHTCHQLIHRDVKPGNLMLLRDGQTIKVLDFGVAAILRNQRRANSRIGTAEYMPYEQLQGQADERSDVYALGATLYHLVTGQFPPPFGVEPAIPPCQINPHVSPALDQVILRAIQRDPGARFQSAAEMEQALHYAQASPHASGAVKPLAVSAPAPRPISPPKPLSKPTALYKPGHRPAQSPVRPLPGAPRQVAPRAGLGEMSRVWLIPLALLVVAAFLGLIALASSRPRSYKLPATKDATAAPVILFSTLTPTLEPLVVWQALEPLDGARLAPGMSPPRVLRWSGPLLSGGQFYQVRLDGKILGRVAQLAYTLTESPAESLNPPGGYGEHRWSARVVNPEGNLVGPAGPEWTFTLLEPPTRVTLPPTSTPVPTLTPTPTATVRNVVSPTRTPTPAPPATLAVQCSGGQVWDGQQCVCPPDKPDFLGGQCIPKGGSGGGDGGDGGKPPPKP